MTAPKQQLKLTKNHNYNEQFGDELITWVWWEMYFTRRSFWWERHFDESIWSKTWDWNVPYDSVAANSSNFEASKTLTCKIRINVSRSDVKEYTRMGSNRSKPQYQCKDHGNVYEKPKSKKALVCGELGQKAQCTGHDGKCTELYHPISMNLILF